MASSSRSTRLRLINLGRTLSPCSSFGFSPVLSSFFSSPCTAASLLSCFLFIRFSKNLRSCFWTTGSRFASTTSSLFTSAAFSGCTSAFFSTTIPLSVRLKTKSWSRISLCTTLIGWASSFTFTRSFFSGCFFSSSFGGCSCLSSTFLLSLFLLNLGNPPLEAPTFSAPPLMTRTRGFFSFASTGAVSSVATIACWSRILYINSFFL